MHDLSLAVCPHDTIRNTDGWYRLVQFLTQSLGETIHFSPALDFEDFHSQFSSADLVYANPSDALTLIDRHGYSPLARPAGIYDEALVVASPEIQAPALEQLTGAGLAIVEGLLPTRVGLALLQSKGITPGALIGCDSWQAVISSVWRSAAPYGILYRDAYYDLSPEGQAMVQVVAATDERSAFHVMCAGPRLAAQRDRLAAVILAMADDAQGRLVLEDMHFSGWSALADADLAGMRSLLA